MLTKVGMRKLRKVISKLGVKGDSEWNDIIITAYNAIGALLTKRFGAP